MNKLVLCGVLSALVSTSASAEEFSGSRIGIGYTQTDVEVDIPDLGNVTFDFGSSVKAEYGYDINKFVGINVSYENNTGDVSNVGNVDGETLKLGVDLGYAMPIKDSVLKSAFIKPYVKLGYQSTAQDVDGFEFIDDNAIYYGLGLRFHYSHFYTDLSIDKAEHEDDFTFTQTALTLGYKF